MEHSDVFLTITEVSVAFAGFSGVVAVFGRRDPRWWKKEDRYRFHSLVETSLVSVFLSLLPFAFQALELSTEVTWRVASGLFLLYMAASYGYHISYMFSVPPEERASSAWWEIYVGMAFDVVIVGLNLYNLAVLHAAGPYLVGLILLVGEGGFYFFRLLMQAFETESD